MSVHSRLDDLFQKLKRHSALKSDKENLINVDSKPNFVCQDTSNVLCNAQQTSLVKNTQQISLTNEKILRLAEDGNEELNSQEDSRDKLAKKNEQNFECITKSQVSSVSKKTLKTSKNSIENFDSAKHHCDMQHKQSPAKISQKKVLSDTKDTVNDNSLSNHHDFFQEPGIQTIKKLSQNNNDNSNKSVPPSSKNVKCLLSDSEDIDDASSIKNQAVLCDSDKNVKNAKKPTDKRKQDAKNSAQTAQKKKLSKSKVLQPTYFIDDKNEFKFIPKETADGIWARTRTRSIKRRKLSLISKSF